MKIQRNGPCPCGSGKKYKACCLKLDRQNRGLRGEARIREAAGEAEFWQADVLAFPASLEDDPGARPAAVLVTAAGFVIFNEILARPSVEVEDLAAELERAVSGAVARVGVSPPVVEVREPEVAAALTEKLRSAGWRTRARAARLAEVEEAMASLNRHVGAPPQAIVPSAPQTWAGWGLPRDWVAEVFRCSAELYRARPWRYVDDYPPFVVEVPDGGRWYVAVLGSADMEYGLGFYSDPEDLEDLVANHDFSPAGRILSLTFDPGRKVPRPMRHEISRAGWEVAAADAYPALFAYGTPAGGLRRRDADDLVAVLSAVVAWTRAVEEDASLLGAVRWRDPETGVELALPEDEALDGPELPPILLEPGDAEGPGARPEAILDQLAAAERYPEPETGWRDRFVEELRGEGLSDKTVDRHAANVTLFLHFLARWVGVPVVSVHELDLRTFLFDWYPRKVDASRTEASGVPASLRRFFGFLHRSGGIHCPWADVILKDKQAFLAHWDGQPAGGWREEDVIEGRRKFFEELELRVFLPAEEVPGVLICTAAMGWAEATLKDELQRRWLLWRDEVIRGGIRQSNEVRAVLLEREAGWLKTPHPAHGGKTPAQAIDAERREDARRRAEAESRAR